MGRNARISELDSFSDSSSIIRMTASADDSTSLIVPRPLHLGQTTPLVSPSEGLSRCLDISSRPNREILPTCTRARSTCNESRILFSTAR